MSAELKTILNKIQTGKATLSEERIMLNEIKRRFKPHKHENYLYDQSEIESEYIIASWNALFRAKLDIGDPIAFATQRGHFATLDYYRKISSQMLVLKCECCSNTMTYDRRNKSCKSCGSKELVGMEKYQNALNDGQFSVNDSFIADLELEDYIKECLVKVNNGTFDQIVKDTVLESVVNLEAIQKVAKRKKLNRIQLESLVEIKNIFVAQIQFA